LLVIREDVDRGEATRAKDTGTAKGFDELVRKLQQALNRNVEETHHVALTLAICR
jgi:hypothetical protein